jgi:L-sorbose 1-phosphate reductase
MAVIPQQQRAVQLVGPDRLELNPAKPVVAPGPHQILAKVEVAGLCFSDLKLLKQFSQHGRKSPVATGIAPQALSEMPNYVPGDKPVVPGHETVVRIVAVGSEVTRHKPGERALVQTDYRWLPTATSNAAFGYNFEGALQEYVLMDERVVISPEGESMLIPVPEDISSSALALVEPWACVERAYVEEQRRSLKPNGRLLLAGDAPLNESLLKYLPRPHGTAEFCEARHLSALRDGAYDDIVYFGSTAGTVEKLFAKLATGGLMILVQGGGRFAHPVVTPVGRIHYGGIRIVGTAGGFPEAALSSIPLTGEIRPNDRIVIVGAAGPMGTMHVIRDLCQGVPDVKVFAGDVNPERLAMLRKLAEPLALKNKLALRVFDAAKENLGEDFDYQVLMVPSPALVEQAVRTAAYGAIVNIFAGIPADKTAELDLNAYIDKRLYLMGTSGSAIEDMRRVLAKVVSRQLDTNLSVAAVSGLDGAIDGIRAVERNAMLGKILVYPSCRGLRLTPLAEFDGKLPLEHGAWNFLAEQSLLKQYAGT